jgi:hypothetical protein
VRTNKDNVAARSLLGDLLEHFTSSNGVRNKVSQLTKFYEGWRRVKGDGNCYYRAISYGLLEQALKSDKRQEIFLGLHNKFLGVSFAVTNEQKAHQALLDSLKQAAGMVVSDVIRRLSTQMHHAHHFYAKQTAVIYLFSLLHSS